MDILFSLSSMTHETTICLILVFVGLAIIPNRGVLDGIIRRAIQLDNTRRGFPSRRTISS